MKKNIRKWLEQVLAGFARKIIAKSNVKIIGITGSVGKSSTKEAIYFVLNNSKKFKDKVLSSHGNLNTEIGLPLAIFGYKKEPSKLLWPFVIAALFIKSAFFNPLKNISVLVLEYAADKPGDIKHLITIAKPDIAVITKICPAHTQEFGSVENIAKEKGILAECVSPDGAVFLNSDNSFSKLIAEKSKAKIFYFNDEGLNLYNEIAGKVGNYLEIPKNEINFALKNYKLPAGRLSFFDGIKDTILIDSTYNASPEAVKEALKYLYQYTKKGRKVAILGDMRELGPLSEKYHREIAQDIIKFADFAILIGPETLKWAKPVLDTKKFNFKSFENFSDARPYIPTLIQKNDIILVKGSQNTLYLERVIELLLKNKIDNTKLCRRGKKWDKIRSESL